MTESDEIRGQVRSELPDNVRCLMDGLEAYADQHINFAFNVRPPPDSYPNAAACALEDAGATIFLREGASIIPQDILHELLHIQRYWIDRIPQLEPVQELADKAGNWDVIACIENILEHLVIVPKEAGYGFAPREVWKKGALSEWSQYPWPTLEEPFSRRLGWIIAWLHCDLLCDPAVTALAERCLATEGVLDEAKRIGRTVARRLPNKGKCLRTMMNAVGILRQEVRLAYYDVRAKKKRYEELPLA
jgi:hypothetical protein